MSHLDVFDSHEMMPHGGDDIFNQHQSGYHMQTTGYGNDYAYANNQDFQSENNQYPGDFGQNNNTNNPNNNNNTNIGLTTTGDVPNTNLNSDDNTTFMSRLTNFCTRQRPIIPRTIEFNPQLHPHSSTHSIKTGKDYAYRRKEWVHIPEIEALNRGKEFSPNVIKNTKYTLPTFIPLFLYNEFRFFFNLYFLLVALSQFIKPLQVGFLFTYIFPLCFVLGISMIKEVYDDLKRYHRDTLANNELVEVYLPQSSGKPRNHHNFAADGTLFTSNTADHNNIELSSMASHGTQQQNEMLVTDLKTLKIPSAQLKVGDVVVLHPGQRVPADCLLLKSFDKSGTAYITTADLDGETDFKLRRPPQSLSTGHFFSSHHAAQQDNMTIVCTAPHLDIYDFKGNITVYPQGGGQSAVEGLSLDNTIWANTVVASSAVLAMVIYTGKDTRAALNANQPTTKTGALDNEVNMLSKLLFCITIAMALIMILVKQAPFNTLWFILVFRFVLLFSSIIPISLRVNLDMAKVFYSYQINNDTSIPGTVVRTSTIPEELGRIGYIFSDKTGTITTNDMVMRIIQIQRNYGYNTDNFDTLKHHIAHIFANDYTNNNNNNKSGDGHTTTSPITTSTTTTTTATTTPLTKNDSSDATTNNTLPPPQNLADLQHFMNAIVLCHNVTPTSSGAEDGEVGNEMEFSSTTSQLGINYEQSSLSKPLTANNKHSSSHQQQQHQQYDPHGSAAGNPKYQGSSPDEVALVSFCGDVGLPLTQRDTERMTIATPFGHDMSYKVLAIFPFTSTTKRMGIVVQRENVSQDEHGNTTTTTTGNDIYFFLKGAESTIIPKCKPNPWVKEEVDSLARIGLRTLVYASRRLQQHEYDQFQQRYQQARSALVGREELVQQVIEECLEVNLDCIGVIAVEDQLQPKITESMTCLRSAGIALWVLTGDKIETALCIARSTRLVDRSQNIIHLECTNPREAAALFDNIDPKTISQSALLVDGASLQILLDHYLTEFLDIAQAAPAVICCRCSPLQKAQVVAKMKIHTGKRCAAIGDGMNDCGMIFEADVGIGIEGKEGSRAAMCADFSVTQFHHIVPLILWHGRLSYKRSAALSQFIMHRGLIISIIQAVFSALYFYVAIPIYTGWLMVGYTTVYTMLPVFSLVYDQDIAYNTAFAFPELYSALQRDKPLSVKSFFVWVLLSLYQGFVIFAAASALFTTQFVNIVSITFTSLILCELCNVILSVSKINRVMLFSIAGSVVLYLISIVLLPTYFDLSFVLTIEFLYKTVLITAAAVVPPALIKFLINRANPAAHIKLSQGGL